MVDLVKIRKKVKDKLNANKEASGAAAVPAAEGEKNAAGVGGAPPPAPPPPPGPTGETPVAPLGSSRLAAFLETAGQRQVVQREEVDSSSITETEVLTFMIAGELYAVDIEKIAEIVTPRPVTRVPNAAPSIVGIFSLRGTIVTLIDVRGRLGHAPAAGPNADARVVVTRLEGENIGFVIDRVLRVVKIESSSIRPQPVVHTSEQDESVRGVFRHAGALTILLDLDKLLTPAFA